MLRSRALMASLVFSLLVAVLSLSACGTTTRFVPTNPSPRRMHSRPAQSVAVFTTSRPNVPYVEVGILQSRQSSGFSTDDMPDIIMAMRKQAAKIGCDAVIINGSSDKVEGNDTTTAQSGPRGASVTHSSSTQTLEGFWGTCIMYSPEPVAQN